MMKTVAFSTGLSRPQPQFLWGLALLGAGVVFSATSARAEVPSNLEATYSEAVIAYNGRDYGRAVKLLNDLIKISPATPELLELKALTLKSSQDDAGSAETYLELIKRQLAAGKGPKDVASYRFEIGMIYFRKENYKVARSYLEEALKQDFNATVCHFFLGMMALKEEHLNEAASHFQQASETKVLDLKASSEFYFAQTMLKTSYIAGATQGFSAALETTRAQLADTSTSEESKTTARQIHDASATALKPFDRHGWFGNAALTFGYDSNVLSVPDNAGSQDATGKDSVKATLQAGVGYQTSPLRTFQFVPSYRLTNNYNFNQKTRVGQFLTHDLAAYTTWHTLDRTSVGVKLESILTFQMVVDSVTNNGQYKPYSFSVPFGPYFKYELRPRLVVGGELTVSENRNYQDKSVTASLARSGVDYLFRGYIKNDQGRKWWNPGASVAADFNDTDGTEYHGQTYTLEVNDTAPISKKTTLNFSLSYALAPYSERPEGSRSDAILVASVSAFYHLRDHLSLTGDFTYTHNGSNVPDVYQYTKFVVSSGVSYSF